MHLPKLAKQIVNMGFLSHEDAIETTRHAVKNNQSFYTYIIAHGIVSFDKICDLVCKEYNISVMELDLLDKEKIPTTAIDQSLMEKHRILPLFCQGQDLYLAVTEPGNNMVPDEVYYNCHYTIHPVLVDPEKLNLILNSVINTESARRLVNLIAQEPLPLAPSFRNNIRKNNIDNCLNDSNPPVVKFVYRILNEAIKQGASDVHIEPYEKFSRIRFRVDGLMHEALTPNKELIPKIIARIKILSSLDIAEKRIPQDGKMQMKMEDNHAIDFRVSIAPTLYGEKAVIRILDTTQTNLDLDAIGMTQSQLNLYKKATNQPNGMILVTGPTGSGKTVSLYAALNQLNIASRNISSVEDPVEIHVAGINQTNINEKAGLTFSKALRAFLRQDPDVIMVGEIRDTETAETASKAAQTGHLVLSTLHANDASGSISRLLNIGISPFHVCSSVSLVIAQRLIRKLCKRCRQIEANPDQALSRSGFDPHNTPEIKIYKAIGCAACTKGYLGRTGVFEVMPMTEGIADIILCKGSNHDIQAQIRKEGYQSIHQSALEKVTNGVTTLEEITRVIT